MARAKLAGKGTAKRPLSELKGRVKRAGGLDKHRAIQGYLPSGYHQSPKTHKLNALQKARVRRMNKGMLSTTFKRVYGFPIK